MSHTGAPLRDSSCRLVAMLSWSSRSDAVTVDRSSGGFCSNAPSGEEVLGGEVDMPPPPPHANKSATRNTTVERPATRILFHRKVQELMLPLHAPWVCQAAERSGFPSRSDLVSD